MNDLIQSVPSPSAYSGGITHTWMGETWMVYGEALVMMSSTSPSLQGARTEFLNPELGFAMATELRKSFWKTIKPPSVFRSRAISSRKGGPRGCPEWAHHAQAWAHPGRAWGW